MGVFDDYFAAKAQEAAGRTGQVVLHGTGDPDATARAVEVGKELSVPPAIVAASPEVFADQFAKKKTAEALVGAPKLSDWLTDPTNGALTKDDLENLTWFEKNLGSFGRDIGRGVRRIGAGVEFAAATRQGVSAADIGRTYDDILAEEIRNIEPLKDNTGLYAQAMTAAHDRARIRFDRISGLTDADRPEVMKAAAEAALRSSEAFGLIERMSMSPTAENFKNGALANAPNTLMGALGAFWDDPVGGTAFVAETAAEFLPVMVAAAGVTAATRSPAAGVGVMSAGSFTTEYGAEVNSFLAERGVSLHTPEDAAALLANTDLLREAQSAGLQRGIIIAAFDAASGGIAGRTLAKSKVGEIVAQGLAQILTGSGGEATAQLAAGKTLDWRDVVIEGLAELATLPVEVAGVAGRGFLRDGTKAVDAGKTAETLAKVDEMAGQSKLKARSPEKFQEAMDAALGDQSLYVPADKLREYYQAKDISLDADALEGLGISADDFAEMVATGADVAIPMSVYAAKISGTEDAAWFAKNSTTDPEGMSVAAAEEFNAMVRDIAMDAYEESETARRADEATRASDVQVYDSMYSQLRQAGRTPDVAEREAQVWASFWRTMASRYGEDALDLSRQFGVEVRGPASEGMPRRRGALDVAINTLRLKGEKAIKGSGLSLREWVKAMGGIKSDRGDLDAMGMPELKAKKGGLPADQMRRRAIEQGYFPDLGNAENPDGTRVDEAVALIDALTEDRYIHGQEPDPELVALWNELNRRGVNLSEASNDEAVAALNSGGMAQDATFKSREYDQGGARGSIVIPADGVSSGKTVINLFETADLSTFLHESGHFFLEAFNALANDPAAPEAMRADMAVIRKFLGAEDGGSFTTDQHETWARGFESYLMEGKAPSLELADAFARFKAWLTRIYRTVAGLNVKINGEVRDVMDRMLATDAEIKAARESAAMRPLFRREAPPGMSDADWQTYQRMARRATEQAEQSLLEKTMAKVRRQKEVWWKAERDAVRKEVEASVNSQPKYRLIEMMANKAWLGEAGREVPDIQIDRKQLVERFGPGVLAELSRNKLGGKRAIYGDNGISPDEAANLFGFSGAGEMVHQLQNAPKRVEAIEAEADRIMLDRYGDPLTDGTIEEEALLAIHSEQQSMTVVAEARHIAAQMGRPVHGMTAKAYRQRARAMVGRMTVREAKSSTFLAAERKAARLAEKAFAKVARGGKQSALAEALQAKEQQILSGMLYSEARAVEDAVAKGRERMQKFGRKSVREKLAGGYIEQIDDLLERFDFRRRGPKAVQRAENLRAFVDRMKAEGREGELAIDDRLLNDAKRVHYSRMTVDELRGLFDTVDNLEHLGRLKQKLIDAQDQRDFDAVVGDIEAAFDANVKERPQARIATAGEKINDEARRYLNLTKNADTTLREIDGFADMGKAWSHLKQRIDQGQSRLIERRKVMAEAFDAIYDRYTLAERRDMAVMRQNDELGIAASKWNLISIALNTGNAENYQRLTNPKTKGGFTPEQVEKALSALDARDWETVQMIWDYIGSFWPEIAAKEKRLTGVEPKKVDAKPMVAAPGIKGGYYPIRYDTRFVGRVGDAEMKDLAQSLMGGRFGKAQTKNGHTKERARSVNQPLLLDLSVAHQHVQQVLYDVELGEAVASSWRILQDQRIKDRFYRSGMRADHDAMEIWLQDVAVGDQVHADGIQRVAKHLRTGFVISRLAMNISSALIQPSGLAQSAVVIGKKAMARGVLDYLKNPGRWSADALSASPMMRERQTTFERDIFQVTGDLEGGPVTGRWKKFQRDVIIPLSFLMMQKVQFYAVDMPTWVGAYQKEIGASGNEAKAREYADLMVRRAQGSGITADRGMLERGSMSRNIRQSEWPRLLTALGSYMFAKGNVAYERTLKTNFRDPAQIMGWAGDMALLFSFEALLYAAVKGFGPDDDEDFATWMAKETLYGMMSTQPGLREVSGGMQGFGTGGILGSIIEKAVTKPMGQAAQGEIDRSLVTSMIDAAGIWFHLPSAQTNAIIRGFFDENMAPDERPNVLRAVGVGSGEQPAFKPLIEMIMGQN